jgi:SulP family sulfate permease
MQIREFSVNIVAAFTLSIVSLSMGAAFGILSGRGALVGMLSAALLSFLASFFGGTKIQCSGPTAPVTTLLVGLLASHSDLSFTGISSVQFLNGVFIISGILLFLMGIFRLGRYISLIPNVVISGFMTGIGLLILKSQFQELFQNASTDIFEVTFLWVFGTVGITILAPYLLRRWLPRWADLLSGTFLALLIGTTLAEVFMLPLERISLTGTGGSILSSFELFSFTEFLKITSAGLWLAFFWAIQLCLTMYLDTLMTSIVMDRLTGIPTNRKRELIVQGSSGMLMGLIGGLPGAQATVRSVLLYKEGATTRWAGVLIGIFCIIILGLFQDILGLIPKAIFIGILIKIAFDIIDFQPLRLYAKELKNDHVWRNFFSRHDDAPLFVTNREMLFIVGTAVTTLLLGLIPAVLFFTSLHWGLGYFLWSKNPMRDLKPEIETNAIGGEA